MQTPLNRLAFPALATAVLVLASPADALVVAGANGPLTVNNDTGPVQVAPAGGLNLGTPLSSTLGFDIFLNYINAPSPSEAAAFSAAEATWESIILGYKDTVGSTTVTIDVNLTNIDGVGGTLGSAGPTSGTVATNYVYTSAGSMTFDTSDIGSLGSAFEDVVLHEMAHVLGFGTLWSSAGVGIPGYQELYTDGTGQYTGADALAAYNAEFSQAGAFIPVELGGGVGTADGHWNEVDNGAGLTGITDGLSRDMRNELMTGWLNDPTFISDTTVQSFSDLGYLVIPEPGSLVLLGLGGLALIRRRHR